MAQSVLTSPPLPLQPSYPVHTLISTGSHLCQEDHRAGFEGEQLEEGGGVQAPLGSGGEVPKDHQGKGALRLSS